MRLRTPNPEAVSYSLPLSSTSGAGVFNVYSNLVDKIGINSMDLIAIHG